LNVLVTSGKGCLFSSLLGELLQALVPKPVLFPRHCQNQEAKEKYFANAHLPKVVTNAKMRMRYIIVQVHVYYTDRTHTISSCDNVLSKPLSDGSVRLTSRGRRGDRFSFFNLSSCIQKQFPLKSAPSISCHTLFHY